MSTSLFFAAVVAFAIGAFLSWVLKRPGTVDDSQKEELSTIKILVEQLQKENRESRDNQKAFVQDRMDKVTDMLQKGMTESTRTLQTQFKESASLIKNVTEKLTTLDATNKQVLDISGQLKDLEMIMKQTKGKGLVGEYWLETMLAHVLPPSQYKMQYKFLNGETVDAVVFFQEKVIPIDAKLSTEHYNAIVKERDDEKRKKLEQVFKNALKERIDETSKYIRPEESTTDFAFMFLPAEGIFYDVLVNTIGTIEINKENLMEYAFKKRVVIISPATFYAYLQTVLQGLKAFRMEESVHEIKKNVEQLGKHLSSYESFMQKMGIHLGTTVSMYDQAYGEFKKIDKDVLKLTDGAVGGAVQPMIVERPRAHVESIVESAKERALKKPKEAEAIL